MNNRTTPDYIILLEDNEVFVFGSNTSGIHGVGAAKTALRWGARWGKGEGLSGQTYALPTRRIKNSQLESLLLMDIANYITKFIKCAKQHPEKKFLVTEVGCGYAGFTTNDIAPLFQGAVNVENIFLPKSFWKLLKFNAE